MKNSRSSIEQESKSPKEQKEYMARLSTKQQKFKMNTIKSSEQFQKFDRGVKVNKTSEKIMQNLLEKENGRNPYR